MTGTLPGNRTTDKRPALCLASRPYDTGYSTPDGCRYRRPAMLELLRLNSYLPPFQRANVQACPVLDTGLRESRSIQFLMC